MDVRNQPGDSGALLWREVEIHMAGVALELVQQILRRSAKNIMDLLDLVQLVRACLSTE